MIFYFIVRYKLTRKKDKKDKTSFGVETVTKTGITVRSKGEAKVADFLTDNNIEYEYEREIKKQGIKPYSIILFILTLGLIKIKRNNDYLLSDFYLPKFDTYVEYWGLGQVKGEVGDQYNKRKKIKEKMYKKYNIKLISVYPEDIKNLNQVFSAVLSDNKTNSNDKENEDSYFCNECGEKVDKTSKFCNECGNTIEN